MRRGHHATFRRRLLGVLLPGALASGVLPTALAQPRAHPEEQSLRSWLLARLKGPPDSLSKQGLSIEWTITRECLLTRDDLESRWEAIEDKPDHPDRHRILALMSLAAQPERQSVGLLTFGPTTWRLDQQPGPELRLEAAEIDGVRWMHSLVPPGSTQLTIIRRDVPFPSVYNIGRYRDLANQYLGRILGAGLPPPSADTTIERVEIGGDAWSATLVDRQARTTAEVRGTWLPTPETPVTTSVVLRSEDAAHRPTERAEFTGWTYDETLGLPVPARIVVVQAEERRDTYDAITVRAVPASQVRAAAGLPDLSLADRALDFRTEDSSAWTMYRDTPRMTWTRRGDLEEYRILGGPGGPSEPQAAAAAAGSASAESAWGARRITAVVLTALTIVLVSVVVVRLRRGRQGG